MTDVGRFYRLPPGRLPSPATCAVCGSGDRDCVGFGLSIKYFGTVLLCVTCLKEASQQLDIVELTEKKDTLDAQKRALSAIGKKVTDGLGDLVDSLNRDLYLVGLGLVPDSTVSVDKLPSIDPPRKEPAPAGEKLPGLLGKI